MLSLTDHCSYPLQGILGQGSGKALEAKSAVDKATRKALKHLTYVPRFRGHTIHYPLTVLYGKTKARSELVCISLLLLAVACCDVLSTCRLLLLVAVSAMCACAVHNLRHTRSDRTHKCDRTMLI